MQELEQLFANAAKTIDNLDIHRSLEGNHIKYTNALMKKSAELDATERSIKNMNRELANIKSDKTAMIAALESIQNEI